MRNLLDMSIEELKLFATEFGEKAFRGKQLFIWLNRGVRDFEEMTDLPKAFREKLQIACDKNLLRIGGCEMLGMQEDSKDGTAKFLFDCNGDAVESVFMKYKYGNSLCVSSQVGCKMGCSFCASAIGGFVRNLGVGEMIDQVLLAEKITGKKINHIVVMGMGEPFDNYENLIKFLKILHNADGHNMSYRNMTVSTSGIIPKIRQFAEDLPQVNLAISLHRADDKGRSEIMPINAKYPVDKLLEEARIYTRKTHRRITFEYALIKGQNDRKEDIRLLQKKLEGILCHVNLIPLNSVDGKKYRGSTWERSFEIAKELEMAGIPATVRRQLGVEIEGACGQLRLRSI